MRVPRKNDILSMQLRLQFNLQKRTDSNPYEIRVWSNVKLFWRSMDFIRYCRHKRLSSWASVGDNTSIFVLHKLQLIFSAPLYPFSLDQPTCGSLWQRNVKTEGMWPINFILICSRLSGILLSKTIANYDGLITVPPPQYWHLGARPGWALKFESNIGSWTASSRITR